MNEQGLIACVEEKGERPRGHGFTVWRSSPPLFFALFHGGTCAKSEEEG